MTVEADHEAQPSELRACLQCGYLLVGPTANDRCPECGQRSSHTVLRKEALDVAGRPWGLGARLLMLRRLPPGWWWTLYRPGDTTVCCVAAGRALVVAVALVVLAVFGWNSLRIAVTEQRCLRFTGPDGAPALLRDGSLAPTHVYQEVRTTYAGNTRVSREITDHEFPLLRFDRPPRIVRCQKVERGLIWAVDRHSSSGVVNWVGYILGLWIVGYATVHMFARLYRKRSSEEGSALRNGALLTASLMVPMTWALATGIGVDVALRVCVADTSTSGPEWLRAVTLGLPGLTGLLGWVLAMCSDRTGRLLGRRCP